MGPWISFLTPNSRVFDLEPASKINLDSGMVTGDPVLCYGYTSAHRQMKGELA